MNGYCTNGRLDCQLRKHTTVDGLSKFDQGSIPAYYTSDPSLKPLAHTYIYPPPPPRFHCRDRRNFSHRNVRIPNIELTQIYEVFVGRLVRNQQSDIFGSFSHKRWNTFPPSHNNFLFHRNSHCHPQKINGVSNYGIHYQTKLSPN